jgi:hypothetical protein
MKGRSLPKHVMVLFLLVTVFCRCDGAAYWCDGPHNVGDGGFCDVTVQFIDVTVLLDVGDDVSC